MSDLLWLAEEQMEPLRPSFGSKFHAVNGGKVQLIRKCSRRYAAGQRCCQTTLELFERAVGIAQVTMSVGQANIVCSLRGFFFQQRISATA